jgi:HD superfamily phosphodiesterase
MGGPQKAQKETALHRLTVSVTLTAMRKLIQQYAKDLTSGRLGSGYEHSFRVYHLAREIAEGLEHDEEILHAACFLHDIEMSVGHPKSSADRAEAILHETGFVPEKIPIVLDAIINHMPNGNPSSIEAKLLFDANLLDSIGAVGFARLSVGAFIWYNMKAMQEILQYISRELSFTEKFHFEKSRELAQDKITFTRAAIDQFSKELHL